MTDLRELTVLGIDLALKSWKDVGSALLSFTTDAEPAWRTCRTNVIAWPDMPVSADIIAAVIDQFVLATGIQAVSIDGPQGWRDPDIVPSVRVMRSSEHETHTPGKTGSFGVVLPHTWTRWVVFSIGTFSALLARPHVTLVNDREIQFLPPLRPGNYYLLECFPTSTWRTSGMKSLPGHRIPPSVVEAYAQMLRERFALPMTSITNHHDHLQAIVAALPAAALLGGPCEAVPRGEAARDVPGTATAPAHRAEGLIWDARPRGSEHRFYSTADLLAPSGHSGESQRVKRVRLELRQHTAIVGQATSSPSRLCLCGCGGIPKTGRFLPGHDAKLKASLLRRIKYGDDSARHELRQLGWERFEPI